MATPQTEEKVKVEDFEVLTNLKPFWPSGLTTKAAADATGLNERTISNARRGSGKVYLKTLVMLRDFLSEQTGQRLTLDDLIVIRAED